MANLRLVGAVAIKVRPDTSKFREETQRGINQELGHNGDRLDNKVKLDVDADTSKAKAKVTRLEEEINNKGAKLNVSVDYDGVKRAKEQIDQAFRSLDNKVISFKMNRESLAAAKQELRELGKDVRVKMRYDKDEAGYKSILDKIARIRREQSRDVDVPISFHTDEASLLKEERKAQAAIDRIKADKTIDIRYSDNYDGMRQAIADLDSQLEEVRKLKITTKLDEASLEAAKADLKDMLRYADVTIKFNEDKQGYEKVLSRIKEIQREKLEKEITFATDDDSLRREAAKYEKLIEDANQRAAIAAQFAPIEIKYNEDKAGYQSVVDHIKKIQQERIVKTLDVNLNDKDLAKELAKFQAKVEALTPGRTVDITYRTDRDSLHKALAQVDEEINKNWDIKVPVNADTASLLAFRAKLKALADAAPVEMKINADEAGYQSVLNKIRDIRQEKILQTISFTTDDAELARTEADIKAKLAGLNQDYAIKLRAALDSKDMEEAKRQADNLKDHIDHMKGSMKIELAGSELTSARLNFIGRDRVVNYITKVNERSVAVTEGLLKSIGGLNTLSSVGDVIENIFTKFDTYSLKVMGLATALGSLVNVGAYAGTAIFRVGEGVVQSLGLLAAAPAVLGAATVGYTIFTAAFNNFFDAFNKDPKIAKSALAELPPLARKTVDSITGLYKGLANPIQERFWEHVGSTLSDAIEHLYPDLKKRLLESTEAVGDFVAGFGRAFTKLSINGDLDKMFVGFKGFFENLSKASEPFFDAFNKFGVQGASLLPRFGQWIADAAKRFDDWTTKAAGNGQILDWIQHGVNSFREMWQVGGDVADIFKAITRAAGLAGTGGLAEFNIHLRKIADQMLAEPWQSRAATIFEGARKGAGELNTGLGDMTAALGRSATWLGNVLDLLGKIGGVTLSNLADLFGGQTYQSGVTAELEGMAKLMGDLGPAFSSLGDIIGNMSKVAGSVFSSMGPVINQIAALVASVTNKIADNLAAVAPKMIATVGGVVAAVTPLVLGLADAANGILGVMSGVPNSFVVAGVAAAAFFALRGLASQFFDSFKQTNTFKNLESNWLAQQVAAGKTREEFKMVGGELQKVTVPTERFSATSAAFGSLTSNVGTLRSQLGELNGLMQRPDGTTAMSDRLRNLGTVAMPGLQNAAKGLLSFLGGPWGVAFAAAGVLIGMFAQQQQDASRHTEELSAALDKQTGKLNEDGLKAIAKSWTDIGKAGDGWANFTRGAKAANETADLLKLNLADVTKTLAEGGPKSDLLGEKLSNLATAMSAVEQFDPSAGTAALGELEKKANDAAGQFGFTSDELAKMGLHAADVQHLADNFKNEAAQVALTKRVFEDLGRATGTTSIQAQQLEAAMKTIGDTSQDAASKIGAIKKALDILNGGGLSARDAEIAAAKASQSAVEQAKALHDQLAGNNALFDHATGLIDKTSAVGIKLRDVMTSSGDAILVSARATYEAAIKAGDTPAKAMEKVKPIIESGQGELQKIADAAGVPVEALQKEWDSFFKKDWTLTATFTASAKQFEAAKKETEASGLAWSQEVWEAFLKANPDPAKLSVDDAKAWADRYANGVYEAQLKAFNPDALAKILEATGQADNYRKGDYTAVMKALNSTNPGVQAALQAILGVKNGDYTAVIKALMDAITAASTKGQLDAIANQQRTAVIKAKIDTGDYPEFNPRTGSWQADGALFTGPGRWAPGLGPTKFFANGGIEQHVAQIARPSSQLRVWAEPETGGEAYIPLAVSKRNRSTAILAQVAQQFGFKLTKAQALEDGGIIAGGNSRAAGLQVHIDTFNQNANDTVEDVGRGIMRQVRNAGVVGILDGI